MSAADRLIADMLITHGVDILRFEGDVRARVLKVLQDMELELTQKLVGDWITDWERDRAMRLLSEVSRVINAYRDELEGTLAPHMKGVALVSAQAAKEALGQVFITLDTAMPTQTQLSVIASEILIEGAPTAEWWKRITGDYAFRFASEVRRGMALGETKGQIVQRIAGKAARGKHPAIPGVMDITRKSAMRLVHNSVQTAANAARRATFEANPEIVVGIMQVSTLDGRTSDICMAYSGATWSMKTDSAGNVTYTPTGENKLEYNGGCPRHWNCRSVEVPVMRTFAERGLNIPEFPVGVRATMDGPVSANLTFAEWLESKPKAFQDEMLGAGRAELWRKKVITLQQLLDVRGNTLSLSKLKAKYKLEA